MARSGADSGDSAARRFAMVRDQVEARGVRDRLVLDAMRRVPREDWVPRAQRARAYDDSALSIEAGQTISQPYILAYMTEAAEVRPGDRVLEIGTGSGYGAAILAEIAAEVYTVERIPGLARAAARRLRRAGYDHVHVRCGDGTLGLREEAPYDAILVAAGGPEIPAPLPRQLAPNGRLVMPIGKMEDQRLIRLRRRGLDEFARENLIGVRFVPLLGAEGWSPHRT